MFSLNFLQTHGHEILPLFQDIFSLLPVATVIDGKILIVHGGISDETDLDFLSSIERHKVRENSRSNTVLHQFSFQKTSNLVTVVEIQKCN